MAITNLTGTKWKLNDGFTAPAGYGIFNVEIDVIISDTTYQSSVLYIGYTGDMMSNPTEQENSNLIEYEEPAFGLMPEVVGAGNLITFNSGADATNTNLITWIQANATQIIAPIQVNMTKSSITLATEGTYCDKDIKITAALQEKAVEPTIGGFEVTPDAGYVGFSKVTMDILPIAFPTVTAGTEQITVAPENYGAKAFDGVFVNPTPSEERLVTPKANAQVVTPHSGKLISSVTVDAVPTEEKTVTANGEITPSTGKFLSKVMVNVPAVVDVATAAEMNAKLVAGNVGKVYRFTGTTDSTYTNGDLYEVVSG